MLSTLRSAAVTAASALGGRSRLLLSPPAVRPASTLSDAFYNEEQKAMMESCRRLVEEEINPYVDEWEEQEMFPAHEVRGERLWGIAAGVTKVSCFPTGLQEAWRRRVPWREQAR